MRVPDGKKFEHMFSGVDRIQKCDGRTDRQICICDSIVRAVHTRRAVKILRNIQRFP